MSARVLPEIDPRWLDLLYRADPVGHALAVWDRLAWPEAIAFQTLWEDGSPTTYLLWWNGLPGCPVLHWGGRAKDPAPLLAGFPPRPFLAIVPPEVAPAVVARAGESRSYEIRVRSRRASLPPGPVSRSARLLRGEDAPALRALADLDGTTVTDIYRTMEPDRDWIVGSFAGPELVAVARAEVRLPEVWHISGVYTRPDHRREGWGTAVVGQLLRDAATTGAAVGLFVREDNAPAQQLYDHLGFDRGPMRVWIDAGASRPP
jgi:GNAT superfamily N-acetyltransferase